MATAREILNVKGTHVYAISKDATVLDAARLMNEHKIGALVVITEGRVQGMLTERDVLQRVVAEERRPRDVKVSDVMTREVICCGLDTPVEKARGLMKLKRVRHLPVIDQDDHGRLSGLISIGDINAFELVEGEKTVESLQQYLYERTIFAATPESSPQHV